MRVTCFRLERRIPSPPLSLCGEMVLTADRPDCLLSLPLLALSNAWGISGKVSALAEHTNRLKRATCIERTATGCNLSAWPASWLVEWPTAMATLHAMSCIFGATIVPDTTCTRQEMERNPYMTTRASCLPLDGAHALHSSLEKIQHQNGRNNHREWESSKKKPREDPRQLASVCNKMRRHTAGYLQAPRIPSKRPRASHSPNNINYTLAPSGRFADNNKPSLYLSSAAVVEDAFCFRSLKGSRHYQAFR